jgi:UDP-N-acetylmuramoyl-L-alanyl-D-glutamate--2,6-diaminopimelate ligase
MDKILRSIEKFIPKRIYKFFQPLYHYAISLFGAIFYGFPSKRLFVIGVTGTKGKSSTTEIINEILEKSGYKTSLSNTIRFKILNNSKPNLYKMSMPGRFFIQKFLRDSVDSGATHIILEITSEGAKQFRNKFIDLDMFIFTNLAPEHIESHGSYESYRDAKLGIAKEIEKSSKPNTCILSNIDDKEGEKFLQIRAHDHLTYSFSELSAFNEDSSGIKFMYKNILFTSPLLGKFNSYNILAGIKVAEYLGISKEEIKKILENYGEIQGRAQKIRTGQNFDVLIDYAHTPESLTEIYKASNYARKKICVLGNTGGGRDVWKRPVMAKIAEKYCDHIILTNEDPYDEDPEKIVDEMMSVITKKPVEKIMDRREAIAKALSLAKEKDIVIITGKGTDPYIMGPNGEKIPWSDKDVTIEELKLVTQK